MRRSKREGGQKEEAPPLKPDPSDSLGTTHETASKVRLHESRPAAALTILPGSLNPRALSVPSTPAK